MNDDALETPEVAGESASPSSDAPAGESQPVSAPVALQLDSGQWDTLSGSLAVSNGLLLALLLVSFASLGSALVGHFTQGWRK